MKKILVLGGYGTFGKRICQRLCVTPGIELIVAGRSLGKAQDFIERLPEAVCELRAIEVDAHHIGSCALDAENLFILINACGPYHEHDYRVAEFCITHGIHYIDLADNRDFVGGISALDERAQNAGVCVITGASTVPGLSAAIVDALAGEFESFSLDYGVTPGNQTDRGVGTVAAILSYVGKPFSTLINGQMKTVYGWQDLHHENFGDDMGNRHFGNCNIPDLDLFPARYPHMKTQRFYAGLELSLLHIGLWLISWPCRWGLIKQPEKMAKILRHISLWFYPLGSDTGGMYIRLKGKGKNGHFLDKRWLLIVRKGKGPIIPATPAVLLTKKLVKGMSIPSGAMPCMGLFTDTDFYDEIEDIEPIITLSAPLYKAFLWDQYETLPKAVQDLHNVEGISVYEGRADAERGTHPFCKFCCWLMALPPTGKDHFLRVEFHRDYQGEHWTRYFGKKKFYSLQYIKNHALYERLGITTLKFDIETTSEKLSLKLRQVYVVGIPVGWLFKPNVTAEEREDEGGRFRVNVDVSLPFFGLLVKYSGWLEKVAQPANLS